MTISTTTSRQPYNGNGVTTIFSVPFRFFQNADLVVQLVTNSTGASTTLALGTHYTVSGADAEAGGSVTMVTPPAVGQTLVVRRVIAATQEVDYVAGDPFPAETHERALDRLTMLSQQGEEVNSRALTLPAGDTTSGEIPQLFIRANKLLAFDSAGRPTVVNPVNDSATDVRMDLADTGSGKGGLMVRWIQSGVGAVQQWISDALRERLSITQFGAVAAVGMDNTLEIQNAINEAMASGKALHIPASDVPFEHGALTVPYDSTNTKRLRIVGDHGISYFLTNKTSALKFTGTSGHALTVQGRAGGAGGNNQGHPVSIELSRVAWIGNASCEGAVRIARGWFARIEKNGFFGFGKATGSVIEFDADDVDAGGISFAGTSAIENNTFASSGRCIVLTGATGGVVNAITIRGNKMLDQSYGVSCDFSPGVPYAEHVIIEGNHFEGTLESDIYSQGAAANWIIERNYFEQNDPLKNAPRVDIAGSANFNIVVQRNTFSKELQAAGQALVRITNAQGVSVVHNVSNSGGILDRYSVQLIGCAPAECEPFECPATPASPYPVVINNALHYRGRISDQWRIIPGTAAGQFVGVSGGDGWPGSTVSTVDVEANKTNGLYTLQFKITVTTKSGVVGDVLFGVLPKPNYGNAVAVPIHAENVTGAKPIILKIAAGANTGTLHDATGAALSYQTALAVGSVFQGQVQYLTQE